MTDQYMSIPVSEFENLHEHIRILHQTVDTLQGLGREREGMIARLQRPCSCGHPDNRTCGASRAQEP